MDYLSAETSCSFDLFRDYMNKISDKHFHIFIGNSLGYIKNPGAVFKSCSDYIVVLTKLPETYTNDSRSSDNKTYAQCRGDKFLVNDIINKFEVSKKRDRIQNSCYAKKQIWYIVGEIVQADDYDKYVQNISSRGIHYFKTIEQAFYWELGKIPTYSGDWIMWHHDGNLSALVNLKNGKPYGKCKLFYNYNMRIAHEGEYVDGEKHGQWYNYDICGGKLDITIYDMGKTLALLPWW